MLSIPPPPLFMNIYHLPDDLPRSHNRRSSRCRAYNCAGEGGEKKKTSQGRRCSYTWSRDFQIPIKALTTHRKRIRRLAGRCHKAQRTTPQAEAEAETETEAKVEMGEEEEH